MLFRKTLIMLLCAAFLLGLADSAGCTDKPAAEAGPAPSPAPAPEEEEDTEGNAAIDLLCGSMTLEQKVSQMIMPAMRTWEGEDNKVTDLSGFPELAEALRRHQYCGVILFGANIAGTEQTVRLTSALQANNAMSGDAKQTGVIPYLISADQEGGSVVRLAMGTRGTGSMALGAAGAQGERHAFATGQIFGEELASLGINVNLGPCLDVITDFNDPGMSTRVFSDDPGMVSRLGSAFADGAASANVITTFKHFPGAGDGSDYPTSIKLTLGQLNDGGLSAYRSVIENGAEMVMVSATTFPLIDDRHIMADGVSEGYYPATLSPRIVGDMLRDELGFEGVVMTDALEMEQFITEPDSGAQLFSGAAASVEHDLQTAEKAINAGCDILLIPRDLNSGKAAKYYDEYIAGIVRLVEEGRISRESVDRSVRRILELKYRHGLLEMDTSAKDVEQRVEAALTTVGSAEHHAAESAAAADAVTLLKNNGVLPLAGKRRVVILGRTKHDNTPITYALEELMSGGYIPQDAYIDNRITGEVSGDKSSGAVITIDRYYNASSGELVYSDRLSEAISAADTVVCLSAVSAGIDKLQDGDPVIKGIKRALNEAHGAGARFVLLSDNLPIDAARFSGADAIVCAYLSSGFGLDPMARTTDAETIAAFNANVPAALRAIFGAAGMPGRLPINIPVLEKGEDGRWRFTD